MHHHFDIKSWLIFFVFHYSFSPEPQWRSWPSLLSGPTMGSEYLAIFIHILMVLFHFVYFQHVIRVCYAIQTQSVSSFLYLISSSFVSGDFVFAVSSDDNSEFWLSTDDSPLNLKLIAWVGMVCILSSQVFRGKFLILVFVTFPSVFNFHFLDGKRMDSPGWVWEVFQSDLQTSLVSEVGNVLTLVGLTSYTNSSNW